VTTPGYARTERGVVHRRDCFHKGDAIDWTGAAGRSHDEVLALVHADLWSRPCKHCMGDPAPGEQLELTDFAPLVSGVGDTLQAQFESFHAANPWVFRALERLAADYLRTGARRVGIGMLFEVLRWHYGRATQGDSFKLNNSYRSRYVRLLLDRHPDWADRFETRELRTA
jgi:hypothetical protein